MKTLGWIATGLALLVIALIIRAGMGDLWRKIVFYGGAVGLLALKAAGTVIPLGWPFIPLLVFVGILTEPSQAY